MHRVDDGGAVTRDELVHELGRASKLWPAASNGTRPPSAAPWPMVVRLPDGQECEIVAVRPGPLEIVLDVTPRRAP